MFFIQMFINLNAISFIMELDVIHGIMFITSNYKLVLIFP